MTKYFATVLSLIIISSALYAAGKPRWKPLTEDGLHDPLSPAITVLQEPEEALSQLPPDHAGNKVLWVDALEEQYIEPRSALFPDTYIEILDMDIIFDRTGEMPMVRFPHLPHTMWLDCKNCHNVIFEEKFRGTKGLNMFSILNGEYCGRCHGAVAFPLTECLRCHSVDRASFTGKPGPQPTE